MYPYTKSRSLCCVCFGVFKKAAAAYFCCIFGSFVTFLAIQRLRWQISKIARISHYKRHQWLCLLTHWYQPMILRLKIWLQKFIKNCHFWTKNENWILWHNAFMLELKAEKARYHTSMVFNSPTLPGTLQEWKVTSLSQAEFSAYAIKQPHSL